MKKEKDILKEEFNDLTLRLVAHYHPQFDEMNPGLASNVIGQLMLINLEKIYQLDPKYAVLLKSTLLKMLFSFKNQEETK